MKNLIKTSLSPLTPPQSRPLLAARFPMRREPKASALIFSPLAWLKLRLFLHTDEVEVGFFGISSADNLLYVEDLVAPKQTVSQVTVAFDDVAVADHFDRCADAGIGPARCGRIWVHTHPGQSPEPSSVDEATFTRVFGDCDWAVMAIVARGGATYARLAFNAGPGGQTLLPVEVDWERWPKDLLNAEHSIQELLSGWMDEYGENIRPEAYSAVGTSIIDDLIELPPRPGGRMAALDAYYDQRSLEDEELDLFEREWEVRS